MWAQFGYREERAGTEDCFLGWEGPTNVAGRLRGLKISYLSFLGGHQFQVFVY